MRKIIGLMVVTLFLIACTHEEDFDASGNFEVDEIIVSAQQNGILLSYKVKEGDQLKKGDNVGQIDVSILELQKQQIEASIKALSRKTSTSNNQIEVIKRKLEVQKSQLAKQQKEKARTENLVIADAATRKQLDDINATVVQLQKQIAVTEQDMQLNIYNIDSQNRSIMSEKAPLEKKVAQLQQQINEGKILNPISGTVLVNYTLQGEMQVVGKPLYKIASTNVLYLKSYITGIQLSEIKIGQQVTVRIDNGKKDYKNYSGTIFWISDKSEFSPKNIQTKDERANLVYAIKVRVKNDGYLKIGMYGEVLWKKN